jgi:putative oxidoreductase
MTTFISTDLALALARATVGLVIAAHGAQKVFGAWGGPGMTGWTQGITRMGLRPPVVWAYLTALTELIGGIALALGLLTPIAAALVSMQMIGAMHRVHWAKGFWNSKGGIEFSLVLALVAAAAGIADPGTWSLDRVLGTPPLGAPAYVLALVVAWLAYVVSSRPTTAQSGATGNKAA